MVKTCDKTATKKTFLGTLYEATQQNVMGLDLLIGFAVIGVIYIKYTGKSARDFGFQWASGQFENEEKKKQHVDPTTARLPLATLVLLIDKYKNKKIKKKQLKF